MRGPAALLASALLGFGACAPPDAGRPDLEARAFLRIVAAEDARPVDGPEMEALLSATGSASPRLRGAAARALGRLERPALVARIAPLLRDPDRGVRREAANALAQAVHRGAGDAALPLLLSASRTELDPVVLGAVARSLGRLRLEGASRREAARTLVALSRGPGGDAPPLQMEGVALGLASWVRAGGPSPRPDFLQARLAELTRYGLRAPPGDEAAARVRALATGAWITSGADPDGVRALLADDAAVVRLAAAGRLTALPEAARRELGAAALADPAPQVRLEAVRRGLAAAPLSAGACSLLLAAALEDPATPVRLAAVDALARPCPTREAQAALLARVAERGASQAEAWHEGAHALRALAELDGPRARPLLPAWAAHPSPFARSRAAAAAGRAAAADMLRSLAADAHANVRTEALRGLAGLEGRAADPDLLAALRTGDDNQVLLTVAGLLEGTGARAEAAEAALGALGRITRPGWETLRDARVALLELLEETGDRSLAIRVEPYLRDFDPAVADRAARTLAAWTGAPWVATPRQGPRLPLPTPEELRAMEGASVVLHMAGGGALEVRLLPWLAPTNAVRLLRMAAAGELDGLTFHRWEPNFVIQGGSPGANEYAGHGAFTRDELGLASNLRGTVGLSTRGRDTGDGQIYVNLVDNVRLDHDYTVFGWVASGMERVDAVLEGDVIERAEVRRGLRDSGR